MVHTALTPDVQQADWGDIHVKWPAARLVGPEVSVEHALEFIRRTDSSFSWCFCNDHRFEDEFKRWARLDGDDWESPRRFREAFGWIDLEHLGSHWIASSWIGGPHGPVTPWGRVSYAINFGKWPSVDEIELDLTAIAAAFPWLSFTLGVWNTEEDDTGDPSFCWRLDSGAWSRVLSGPYPAWPSAMDVGRAMHEVVFQSARSRETTWPIEALDRMWGTEVRRAWEVALKEPEHA